MLDDLYEGAHFENSPDNSPDNMDNTNDGYFEKLMKDARSHCIQIAKNSQSLST